MEEEDAATKEEEKKMADEKLKAELKKAKEEAEARELIAHEADIKGKLLNKRGRMAPSKVT